MTIAQTIIDMYTLHRVYSDNYYSLTGMEEEARSHEKLVHRFCNADNDRSVYTFADGSSLVFGWDEVEAIQSDLQLRI